MNKSNDFNHPKEILNSFECKTTTSHLDFFDFNELTDNSHIVLIAEHKSERSFFMRNIISNLWNSKKIDGCVVFSPTDKCNPFYSKFILQQNIFFELKTDVIQSILNNQIDTNNEKNICIVLDNCLARTDNHANGAIIIECTSI
jgi:hypothetical protein